ncbi:prepilin-type N-terminal cleavage/methylation domain-containing protein [Pirellulaceae bacterium SH501]
MQDPRRFGFTLLELILALMLTAVVAGLVGSLVQLYLINQNTGREQVKQAQLARAILNMIAEDIRTTVRYQPFDSSGLSEILGGGQGGGGQTAGAAPTGQAGGGAAPSPFGADAMSGTASPTSGNAAGDSGTTALAMLPPGIYGSESSIEIDISKLPRPDEYYATEGDLATGTLGDMPSDIKTVNYYVQAPRPDGVKDPLAGLTVLGAGVETTSAGPGGLVRRSLDRAITQYAYEQASTDSLLRTGELVATEVISIEFQYFDGTMWQLQWDSSVQGLPKVIKITIALQRESKARTNPMEPGMFMSSITPETMREFGIDIYSVNAIIPGAHLLSAPQASGSGTSSMGF